MEDATVAACSTGEAIAAGDRVAIGEGSSLDDVDGATLVRAGDGDAPDGEHAASTMARSATSVTGTIARFAGNDEPAAKATGRFEVCFEMGRRERRREVTWPT